jgi:hypothetical protein
VRTALLSAVALTLLLSVSAGCGGPDREKQLLQAERMARAEVAGSLKDDVDDGDGAYKVHTIKCTHEGDGQFSCMTTANRSYDKDNVTEAKLVPVTVTCDETRCSARIG